ncbi:hypothetical protein GL279_08315 [Paracoccus limosus]|uniref:YcaO domain-containing protein n=1 Tax=Paracoccus limosus TaxID=913252 RepID=A0A844H180_9RHOB|nr:YcaO-like family protein [Paracoccus limosus]MTH34602.1 hypothetical protein [Paracoccus limosus]
MIQDFHRPQDLAACWRSFDWRENFLAPGLVILQALTPDGQTASGAGLNRDEAWHRCLGETAEILALRAHRDAGRAFDPTRDGIAAHVDTRAACDAALFEAHERRAIAGWWLGWLQADPVAPDWLHEAGILGSLDLARRGAALKRRTDWWLVRLADGPCTMICRSASIEGQEPVLGYGAHPDPAEAARKAMRELLLMELNLIELLAARSHGLGPALEPVGRRIRDYALRGSSLFAEGPAVTPRPAARLGADWLAPAPRMQELATAPISVWLCQPDLPAPRFTAETGSPYL